jgi:hypothetical protein
VKALVAALVLAALPAAAQPQERPARAREELFKMVDAYIVSNLQESVGLSDEQFTRVLPLLKKLQADRRDFVFKRQSMLRELRSQIESGRATEPRVADVLKDLRTLEADEPAALRRNRDALDAVLTPIQQAKLRILEAQVEQRLREIMGRARAGAGQKGLRPPE